MNGHHQGEMLQLRQNLGRREEKGMERVNDSVNVIILTCQVNDRPKPTINMQKQTVFDLFMGFVGYNKSTSLII